MNVLGKTVLAVGNVVEVGATGGGEIEFEVGGSGGLATLKILDDNGRQIGSRPLGFVTPGKHEFELGSAAAGLAPGAYRFAVDVVDAAGKAVPAQSYVSAKIDGVRYGSDGPILTSGSLRIPFGAVLQITAD
jgi:flagellar hook assembly protein FlgD